MWPLRNPIKSLKTFCNTDDEWHAVCMGFLFPIPLWWPLLKWNSLHPARIMASEGWYVGLGMTLRIAAYIYVLTEVL